MDDKNKYSINCFSVAAKQTAIRRLELMEDTEIIEEGYTFVIIKSKLAWNALRATFGDVALVGTRD
jgi:hypothetical protein